MSRKFGNSYELSLSPASVGVQYSATQTNEYFQTGYVYIPIASVTGWSSSSDNLSVSAQWSPDGGATWLNLGPYNVGNVAVAQYNTTYILFQFNESLQNSGPLWISGAGNLPRTWRLVLTVPGGSSAVYTFGSATVEYMS